MSSLTKIKSVPSILFFFKGELSTKLLKVNVGLILANRPNFFLIFKSPCSGLTFAEGLLSNSGKPIAPNNTESESKQRLWVSFGYGSPFLKIDAAPTIPSLNKNSCLNLSPIALQTFIASLITSGPIPSPGRTAIFFFI